MCGLSQCCWHSRNLWRINMCSFFFSNDNFTHEFSMPTLSCSGEDGSNPRHGWPGCGFRPVQVNTEKINIYSHTWGWLTCPEPRREWGENVGTRTWEKNQFHDFVVVSISYLFQVLFLAVCGKVKAYYRNKTFYQIKNCFN